MPQWANDAFLLLTSALLLDQLVNCLNQTRIFVINGNLLNRKPFLFDRLGLTHDEDTQTHDLVSMTIQTHESKHDTEVLYDQLVHLQQRLKKVRTREDQAIMKRRACLERKQFLLQEKGKMDKQIKEQCKCMRQEWTSHYKEMRSLKQTLADTLKRKIQLVSEVGLLRKAIMVQKDATRAKSRAVKHVKILSKAASDEARHAKAAMEGTRRHLEKTLAGHYRFMTSRIKGNLELQVRVAELRVQAKQIKLVCIRQEWQNHLKQIQVDNLRGELARLQVDLVPECEVIKMKQRYYQILIKTLRGLGVVFLVEAPACLGFFVMLFFMQAVSKFRSDYSIEQIFKNEDFK